MGSKVKERDQIFLAMKTGSFQIGSPKPPDMARGCGSRGVWVFFQALCSLDFFFFFLEGGSPPRVSGTSLVLKVRGN